MSKHKSANARRAARDGKALELKDTPIVSLKLGNHQFPVFTALHAAFGADAKDYPDLSEIPDEFQSHHNRFARVFSGLFYNGGSLGDHGLKLKEGVDRASFYTTLRALMCSFAPKHEVKEATCAWLLAEHTEAA